MTRGRQGGEEKNFTEMSFVTAQFLYNLYKIKHHHIQDNEHLYLPKRFPRPPPGPSCSATPTRSYSLATRRHGSLLRIPSGAVSVEPCSVCVLTGFFHLDDCPESHLHDNG